MLILRFRQTFRERCGEWIMAAILTGWGWQVLQPYPLFDRPFFALLRSVATESFWGWSAFLIGLARLAVLFINGALRSSPQLRQIGSAFGLSLWLALAIGALSVDYGSPAWAPYAGLFVFDLLSINFAGQDGARYRAGATDGR